MSNQFSENIAKLDREIEVDGVAALRGLPPDYLDAHPPGPGGRIRITTKYPDFLPAMAYCEDSEVHRRLLQEFTNRAYPENLPVLDELMNLRGDFARTLGYPSYAAFALEDKMMGTPAAAHTFLERLGRLLQDPTARDLGRYLERKRKDHPEAQRLEPWDTELFGGGYYDGKIRTEEFGVDTRLLREYLPYLRVRDGLLHLCQELFGVSFHRTLTAEVWHPTVEAYDVTRGSVPLGRCYLDLIPRDGKFSHAACFGVREGVAGVQLPQAALICNFLSPNVPVETARMEWKRRRDLLPRVRPPPPSPSRRPAPMAVQRSTPHRVGFHRSAVPALRGVGEGPGDARPVRPEPRAPGRASRRSCCTGCARRKRSGDHRDCCAR